MFINLNDKNVLLYAVKSYDGFNYIKSEFTNDYRLFRYSKRLLNKYRISGEIRINLLLNHLTMIYNTFGGEASTRILFLKVDQVDYSVLKTLLIYINRMPKIVYGINGYDIISSDIPINIDIANMLRKL